MAGLRTEARHSTVDAVLEPLCRGIGRCEAVRAIGLSSQPLPARPADGDIDLFVYCSTVPPVEERTRLYAPADYDAGSLKGRVFVSEHWGDADFLTIGGIETWVMYFAMDAAAAEAESIRCGLRFRPESGFYPSGRLAMLRNMAIIADKDSFLAGLKRSLESYPLELGRRLLGMALEVLRDDEDLLRAVGRKDLLFYHASIDTALEALLQALYVLNRELFPSRKRVRGHLATFALLPDHCHSRMERIIRLGSGKRSLGASFRLYSALRYEVLDLVDKQGFGSTH